MKVPSLGNVSLQEDHESIAALCRRWDSGTVVVGIKERARIAPFLPPVVEIVGQSTPIIRSHVRIVLQVPAFVEN